MCLPSVHLSLALVSSSESAGMLGGLASMAVGEVEQVELVADALGFDADLAEALCVYANPFAPGRSPTHSVPALRAHQTLEMTLSGSRLLRYLRSRVEVRAPKVAALLSLACGDHRSAEEAMETLGLQVAPPYARAVCAAMECAREPPADAPSLLMVECKELVGLYGVTAPCLWAMALCLLQGNLAVLPEVAGIMGWSNRDRTVASALVMLAHPLPLRMRSTRADESDWLAERNAAVACSMSAHASSASPAANAARRERREAPLRAAARSAASLTSSRSSCAIRASDASRTSLAPSATHAGPRRRMARKAVRPKSVGRPSCAKSGASMAACCSASRDVPATKASAWLAGTPMAWASCHVTTSRRPSAGTHKVRRLRSVVPGR
mmetsp:Transcript_23200/g.62881  ORF Transcript_23200/g.62881 Transcript_23200/m.62881 type:complete len:382 (-) Transcript_23200:931-2076(-)